MLTLTRFLNSHYSNTILVAAEYDVSQYKDLLFLDAGIPNPYQFKKVAEKRIASYLAGRCVASIALDCMGQSGFVVERGICGEPIWPTGIVGSISHTHNQCVCLISRGPYLAGVDTEVITPINEDPNLVNIISNGVEKKWIRKLNQEQAKIQTTLLFSAKETLFKALFPLVQEYFDFTCAQVCSPPSENRLTLRLTKTLHDDLKVGDKFFVNYTTINDHVYTWLLSPRCSK